MQQHRLWYGRSFRGNKRLDGTDRGHRRWKKAPWLRLKDSLVLSFMKTSLYPQSTTPNQTSIQPSQTVNAGNLKKTGAKGQQGMCVVQTQEIPTFSDKCCSCIKHFTATTVFTVSSCMTTGKHKRRNSVRHLHRKTRRTLTTNNCLTW